MNSVKQVVETTGDISHRLVDASNTLVDLSFSAILPDDISARACSIETVELSVNLLEQTSVLENIIYEELNNKHDKIVETIVETIDEQIVETIDEQIVETIDEQIVETIDEQIVEKIDEQIVEKIDEQIVEKIDEQLE